MQQSGWIQRFTELGAFWVHDDNPRRPHALLTSGNHSNGFFNGSLIVSRPDILESVCTTLRSEIIKEWLPNQRVDMVIGSAHGATFIAYEIAKQIVGCKAGFTEPVEIDGKKEMLLRRFPINPLKRSVLVVEDVMTTGGTTKKTIIAIETAGGRVINPILVVVNRSGRTHLDNRPIFSLIDREMPIWTPSDCPLCRNGSEAISPKGNWDRLTASY